MCKIKVAIMQPYLFPYIGYFQLITCVDVFVIYDDVQYINKGWINRNYFLAKGDKQLFTFSLRKESSRDNINQRFFSDKHDHDVETFLKLLIHEYSQAPHFKHVYSLVKNILETDDKNIASKIEFSLKMLCDYLQITTNFRVSSKIAAGTDLKGQQRIIEICKSIGATHYINPIGGVDLYSRDKFDEANITLSFLQPRTITYHQLDNLFIPNLSIIDVLMFNDKNKVQEYLNEFDLI